MCLWLHQHGYQVELVDIAENCLDPEVRAVLGERFRARCLWDEMLPMAEMVICVDVLEHIPEEHVAGVIANLKRYEHGFVQVALFPSKYGNRVLHLTVQPAEWWEDRLGRAHLVTKRHATFRW